jgi:hypothetical protein
MLDSLIFAYFGPETTLPLTSAIACVVGALMMFGRAGLQFCLRSIGLGKSKSTTSAATVRPSAGRVRTDNAHHDAGHVPHEPVTHAHLEAEVTEFASEN